MKICKIFRRYTGNCPRMINTSSCDKQTIRKYFYRKIDKKIPENEFKTILIRIFCSLQGSNSFLTDLLKITVYVYLIFPQLKISYTIVNGHRILTKRSLTLVGVTRSCFLNHIIYTFLNHDIASDRTLSNKGGRCLLLDGFKYRKYKVNISGNVVWRCYIKNCTSTVTTCSKLKNILKINNTHKHEQVETVKIQIQEVRNVCKRKACDDIHERPRKIIRKEVSSIENNEVIGSNDVNLIRKSIYNERRKLLPTLPKSLEDALNFVSNSDILTCQNEKMTFVYKQDEIIIVTCKKNIEFLCNHCDEYLADGQVLNINIIHLDCEIAAHTAVQNTFSGVTVKGCRFHFGQALWRKIQSNNNFRQSYNAKQNETVHEVTDAFTDLMSICPQNACSAFGDYILNTYIEGQFPMKIWTHPINANITTRTTNGAERFHQGFNSEFYSPNPSVFMVFDVLRNIHIDTVTRMNQYHKGIQNIIRPIEKQKQEHLFQFWEEFLRDGDRIKFLKNVGNRFQPIKL
ncbi:hypothetical protein AGLY_005983 [Aphis glycines]|uniref:FLYWCH-type domain-containing protein n=1 Tax=Aphis glycines TaxID=307491 RepID=A0A6G0TSE6_APHGL|nr:hypothetical protein AGLY_005983 [Aphis glycines]